MFGSRCGGSVAVCHGVKPVISGYVVAYLLAAVCQSAADGADSDGFVGSCGTGGGVGGVSLNGYLQCVEVKIDMPHGGVNSEVVGGGDCGGHAVDVCPTLGGDFFLGAARGAK